MPPELFVASRAQSCPFSSVLPTFSCPWSLHDHALFPKTTKEEGKKLKKNKPAGPSRQVKRALLLIASFYQLSKISHCSKKDKRRGQELKEAQDQCFFSSHLILSRRRTKEKKGVGENFLQEDPPSRVSLFANFRTHPSSKSYCTLREAP